MKMWATSPHEPRRYAAKITRVLSARHRLSSCPRWVIGAGLGPGAQSRRQSPRQKGDPFDGQVHGSGIMTGSGRCWQNPPDD
jgi:hypothetical protein